MKKKAKQLCFVRFIVSLFADVAPVINNHSIQHFCSSLCVPNRIHLQFVFWNKHNQLENLTRFPIFIGADAEDAEAAGGMAGPGVPTEAPRQRNLNHWQSAEPETTSNISEGTSHTRTQATVVIC